MSTPSVALVDTYAAAVAALAAVSREAADYRALDDNTLLSLGRLAAQGRQLAETNAAMIAGQFAERSAHTLGHSGLAQRLGHRTVEELVRATSGSTSREAATAVHAGRMMLDAHPTLDPETGETAAVARPWLVEVGRALAAGLLSAAAAESIGNGLGRPTDNVTALQLAAAVDQLCREGGAPASGVDASGVDVMGSDVAAGDTATPRLDADRLYRRARELRDDMDAAGIAQGEAARRDARALRFFRRADGTARLTWDMDPETAAIGGELYDRLTSPRRGGPRFVEHGAGGRPGGRGGRGLARGAQAPNPPMRSHDASLAEPIIADTRTTEQRASDVFLHLLRAGASTDSRQLLGSGGAVVNVLVTASTLRARTGRGSIEGQAGPISVATVERLACEGSIVDITFDEHGRPLDVGREQRLFTRRQRAALAARDGGCVYRDCERPPSWCEAHHVQHWKRDGGSTNIDDGLLLCRHHHLLLHNNGWEIRRTGADYWLVPPPDIDPDQVPIPMPSKSAVYRELRAEQVAAGLVVAGLVVASRTPVGQVPEGQVPEARQDPQA